MILLPNTRDKRNLPRMVSEEYKLHWMDDENFDYPHPKQGFDLRTYTEKCSDYIRNNRVDGIFYSHDLANIVAGVLCERHSILGPTLESIIEVFTPRGSQVRQNRTTGVWLARFELFGSDFVQMCERADYLREKMLKQPELSPKPPARKKIVLKLCQPEADTRPFRGAHHFIDAALRSNIILHTQTYSFR